MINSYFDYEKVIEIDNELKSEKEFIPKDW